MLVSILSILLTWVWLNSLLCEITVYLLYLYFSVFFPQPRLLTYCKFLHVPTPTPSYVCLLRISVFLIVLLSQCVSMLFGKKLFACFACPKYNFHFTFSGGSTSIPVRASDWRNSKRERVARKGASKWDWWKGILFLYTRKEDNLLIPMSNIWYYTRTLGRFYVSENVRKCGR